MLAEVMREDVYRNYRIRLEFMLGIYRDTSEREMHRSDRGRFYISIGHPPDGALLTDLFRSWTGKRAKEDGES